MIHAFLVMELGLIVNDQRVVLRSSSVSKGHALRCYFLVQLSRRNGGTSAVAIISVEFWGEGIFFHSIFYTVRNLGSGQWAVDSGQSAVDNRQWTMDSGQLVDNGQWAVGSGQ
jgi:hypothetical protein